MPSWFPAVFRILWNNISAMFPDTRQYLRCYPAFETFCGFKFTAEDERVETGFVNDSHFLDSARCFHFGNTFIFYFNSFRYCTSRFCISQRRCHIFPHKPWFSIFLNTSQISELWMIEDLTLRSGRGRRRGCGWCIPSLLAICTCLYFSWCYIIIITNKEYVRNKKYGSKILLPRTKWTKIHKKPIFDIWQ